MFRCQVIGVRVTVNHKINTEVKKKRDTESLFYSASLSLYLINYLLSEGTIIEIGKKIAPFVQRRYSFSPTYVETAGTQVTYNVCSIRRGVMHWYVMLPKIIDISSF